MHEGTHEKESTRNAGPEPALVEEIMQRGWHTVLSRRPPTIDSGQPNCPVCARTRADLGIAALNSWASVLLCAPYPRRLSDSTVPHRRTTTPPSLVASSSPSPNLAHRQTSGYSFPVQHPRPNAVETWIRRDGSAPVAFLPATHPLPHRRKLSAAWARKKENISLE